MRYQHSRVFHDLKSIKEDIAGNLTTLQYLQTLDYFIARSLHPILQECPTLVLSFVAKVVAYQSLHLPVKLTSDDKAKLPVHLFNAITSPKKSESHIRSLYLNRGVWLGFVAFFLNRGRRYLELHSPFVKMDKAERLRHQTNVEVEFGVRLGGSLYRALKEAEHWDTKARAFKAKICQKYTRMALVHAQRVYKEYNHQVHLDDVSQIYLMIVSKAVDRCDSRQGVLTTFIQAWFKSARGEVASLSSNKTSSLDSLSTDLGDSLYSMTEAIYPDTLFEELEHISFIAKQHDPSGCARIHLGIPEYLTPADRWDLEVFAL